MHPQAAERGSGANPRGGRAGTVAEAASTGRRWCWQAPGQRAPRRRITSSPGVDDTGDERSFANVPIADGTSGVTAIAPGGEHTLALLEDGTAIAWGQNGYGQLGNPGVELSSPTPVPVEGLSEVRALAAGGDFSLALLDNGTVMAWGADGQGELGIGSSETARDAPVEVSGLSGVQAIAAGGTHALALMSDGTVVTWGSAGEPAGAPLSPWPAWNTFARSRRAGNRATHCSKTARCSPGLRRRRPARDRRPSRPRKARARPGPVGVSGSRPGKALPARARSGSVMTWGRNDRTDSSVTAQAYQSEVPVEVTGLHDATGLAVGAGLDVALLEGETVAAWGIDPGDEQRRRGPEIHAHQRLWASNIVCITAGGSNRSATSSTPAAPTRSSPRPGRCAPGPGSFEPSWGPAGTTVRIRGANVGEATGSPASARTAPTSASTRSEELTVVVPPGQRIRAA